MTQKTTYRGVEYDADQHKKEFKQWWNQIHCDATKNFQYRGAEYRAIDQCQAKFW